MLILRLSEIRIESRVIDFIRCDKAESNLTAVKGSQGQSRAVKVLKLSESY